MSNPRFTHSSAGHSGQQSYEQDPRARRVDEYTASHLLTPSHNKYHDALNHAYENSVAKGLPDIACYPSQGKFLALQTRLCRAKHVLELGTLGGYSSIWFASAGPDVHVTSIEVDAHHKAVADENIRFAGLDGRIEVLLGAGLDVLPTLVAEVKAGRRETFDVVFIDADKENNLGYFQLAMEMVRSGACIYVDNVVRRGRLVDEDLIRDADPSVLGSRRVVEGVGRDERVEATVLQTVSEKNYDGFLLAVVK